MNVKQRELKHNELADFLGHQVDHYRGYAKPVIGTLVAVAVLAGIYQYSRVREAEREGALWAQYVNAVTTRDATSLKSIGEKNPNTITGGWAYVMLGDTKLGQAINELNSNRGEVRNDLQDAKDAYDKARSNADPEIKQRATLGLAKTLEALGDLTSAKNQYQEIVSKWPGTVFATQAESRLKDISRGSTQEFYKWLAEQENRPPVGDGPGIPGLRPGGLDTLPTDGGDFKFGAPITPSTGSDQKAPETKSPATKAPDAEKPAEPAKTPDASKAPEASKTPETSKTPPAAPKTETKPNDAAPAEKK